MAIVVVVVVIVMDVSMVVIAVVVSDGAVWQLHEQLNERVRLSLDNQIK